LAKLRHKVITKNSMHNKTAWSLAIVGVVVLLMAVATVYLFEDRMPSFAHLWKLHVVGSAVTYLLSFFGVWITYVFAKSFVEANSFGESWLSRVKHYLLCVCACALIAWFCALTLGTHQEDQGLDSATVVDYQPSNDERTRHALVAFLCLLVPAFSVLKVACKNAD
jgi:uncharacterized membrane protein